MVLTIYLSTLIDENGRSLVKSTFDWGNALIIPVILAIPSLIISPSRHLDAEGLPAIDVQDLPNVQGHYYNVRHFLARISDQTTLETETD